MIPRRAHIDAGALQSASLRASVQAARGGGGRTAARRALQLPPLPDLDATDPRALRLFPDPASRGRVFALASAALNGAALAMLITAEDRRQVIAALGDRVRAFGVAQRSLSRIPDSRPDADAVLQRIAADQAVIETCWRALLPLGLIAAPDGPCDPRAAACLNAALETLP